MYRRLSNLRKPSYCALRFQRVRNRVFRRLDSLRYIFRRPILFTATNILIALVLCGVSATLHSEFKATTVSSDSARLVSSKPINSTSRPKLLKHNRLRLVEAQAQGKRQIALLVAAASGANEAVARAVISLGGKVQYRTDDVSYLRVKLPIESVEKFSRSADIEALDVDGAVGYLSGLSDEPVPSVKQQDRIPPPDRDTPAENPYLPTKYIGAPQFMAAHPTFDGRGVTIAVVDVTIDLFNPELQTAKTLDGQPTRKIVDVLNAVPSAIDPSDDEGNASAYLKVNMTEQVMTDGGKLIYRGISYTAPAVGRFRIGMLDERLNNSRGDLNCDGNPAGSSGLFAVLWDEATNTVWVDTNQNHSFADEKPMTDYRVRYDIGLFGKDDPKTLLRETVGFTVQTDAPHKLVFVNPGNGVHGTGVAGVAAGKGFFGGRIHGVAPEAQIVSVPFVLGAHSELESLIVAVQHPRVDLVTYSGAIGLPVNDGSSAFAIVLDRLIEKYNKPIFAAGGNASDFVTAVLETASASRVIAVSSYVHRETSRVNYGVAAPREDNVDIYSARGPRKDGGFKPNILATTQSLTTFSASRPSETRNGVYTLPPGYGVMGGTSTATPMAAGGAALLISAAKQSGVHHDVDRLRWAIMSSARYLPGYGAYTQGAGLFQVGAAWEALKAAPTPVRIISRASVNAALSQYLKEPGRGPGVFEREGWSAGQTGERQIAFTRTSGPAPPMTYSLRWIGNDGTFTSQKTIALPLDRSVSLTVTINPKSSGVHSAILSLDEPGGAPAVYQVMNTVVAAEQLTATNQFSFKNEGETLWFDSQVYYFNVPAGTLALKADVQIAKGNVFPILLRPSGVGHYVLADPSTKSINYQTGGSWSRGVVRPEPGVWQLLIDNKSVWDESRFAAETRARFTVSIAVLGAEANPAVIVIDPTERQANYTREVSYKNYFGSFTGGVVNQPLGSAFSAQPTLLAGAMPQVYEINLPSGTAGLSAHASAASGGAADVDLYLFDCTGKECVLKDFSQRAGSNEQVEIENPTAGKWKVMLDPFAMPSGKTTCDYSDIFTHPAFGLIAPAGKPVLRPGNATWMEQVNVRVDAVPLRPRYLAGVIAIETEVGANTRPQSQTNAGQPSKRVVLGAARIEMKVTK